MFSDDNGYQKGYPDGDVAVMRHFRVSGFLATPKGLLRASYKDEDNRKGSLICDCLERDTDVYTTPQSNIYKNEHFRNPDNYYEKISTNLNPIYLK